MPFGFPSHQGLIAPLWRIWPDRFSVLGLWVGAIVPDAVDGFATMAVQGHFHQWIGHSLLGASAIGVPVGLVLTHLVRRLARRLATTRDSGTVRDTGRRVATWIRAVDISSRATSPRRLAVEALSVWIGALSHVFFDLLSHERSQLLWPLASDPEWLGAWWSTAWFRVSLVPGYPGYPIGPHFVGWLLLSLAGAVMFFRWPPRTRDRQDTET